MGATSVTGISGVGDVSGKQKGSEHMSLGVNKLIGPRVVAAGVTTVMAAGSGATVTYTASPIATTTTVIGTTTVTNNTGGIITSVNGTPAAGGTLYPPLAVINLLVTGGAGSIGGVVTGTTNGAGVITAFSLLPLFGGTGYTTSVGAATTGAASVYLPEATVGGDAGELGGGTGYLGFVNDTSAPAAAANVVAIGQNYMVVSGTAGHVLSWMIVKAGM